MLTYAMGRHEDKKIISITEKLAEQGWENRPFKGFSGKDNRVEDFPGFVGYNRSSNEFTIVLRGSQTLDGEVSSADWEVNFDNEYIDTPHGKMHRGFYKRTTAMMGNIMEQLKSFYDEIPIESRKNARIMVSGHSQGAALATLVSALLAESLKDERYLGRDFKNNKSNTIVTYLLSAPRVVDQVSREWIYNVLGKQNIIRQNVTGVFLSDPVPYGAPGKTLTKIVRAIPFIGKKLASKLGGKGGAASVGYLAADMSKDVLKRQVKAESQSLLERTKQRIGASAKELSSKIDKDPRSFFKVMAPQAISVTLSKIIKNTITDSLLTYFAPMHYGGTKDQLKEGAYFQPSVVAGYNKGTPDLSRMLEQGTVVKKKGFSGFISRLKSLF